MSGNNVGYNAEELIRLTDKVDDGTATAKDQERLAELSKLYWANNGVEQSFVENWMAGDGGRCLDCWEDGDFQPSKCPFPMDAILVFAAHFADTLIRNGGLESVLPTCYHVLSTEAILGFRLLGFDAAGEVLQLASADWSRRQSIQSFVKFDRDYYTSFQASEFSERCSAVLMYTLNNDS